LTNTSHSVYGWGVDKDSQNNSIRLPTEGLYLIFPQNTGTFIAESYCYCYAVRNKVCATISIHMLSMVLHDSWWSEVIYKNWPTTTRYTVLSVRRGTFVLAIGNLVPAC
jgi:hypothetical protein